MNVSRKTLLLPASPSLLMLLLSYSLAIHMHQQLGGWPNYIGEQGFPTVLVIHANVATMYFWVLLLVSFFGWPAALVASLILKRRRLMLFVGAYLLFYLCGIGLFLLAPTPFLRWWQD
jgi:hypothetical protein